MSETEQANQHQNTPSGTELDAQIAADEAARFAPEPVVVEPAPAEPVEPIVGEPEESDFEKRLSRLAYEKRQSERQLRQVREELARAKGDAPAAPKDEEVERLVLQRAAELAAVQAYNDKANAIYEQGTKEFPDFEQRLRLLRDIGGITPQFVEACEEVGDAHRLIHYLCRNIDEAERITQLAPHRMGAALAKVHAKMSTPKPQSQTPAPITPVTGRTNADMSIEDSVRTDGGLGPIDAWMRREDERWAQRRRRY